MMPKKPPHRLVSTEAERSTLRESEEALKAALKQAKDTIAKLTARWRLFVNLLLGLLSLFA